MNGTDVRDFSEAELQALIDTAIGGTKANTDHHVLFANYPPSLFKNLHSLLVNHVSGEVASSILAQVRQKLYADVSPPAKSLQLLNTRISNCTACPRLGKNQQPAQFTINQPDMLVVAQHPWRGSPVDVSLVEELKTAGFSSGTIGRTSVVKCNVNVEFNAKEVATCVGNHLFAEVQLIAPRVVLALGSVAKTALLGTDVSDSALNTICWVGPWPVIPTVAVPSPGRNQSTLEQLQVGLNTAHTYLYS